MDVTFPQFFRPSGGLEEGKRFYSGKDKLYGFKVEVSIIQNGLAIWATHYFPAQIRTSGSSKEKKGGTRRS